MPNKVIVRILLSYFELTGNSKVKLDFSNITRYGQKTHQTISIIGNTGFPDKKFRMNYRINTNFFMEGSGLGNKKEGAWQNFINDWIPYNSQGTNTPDSFYHQTYIAVAPGETS